MQTVFITVLERWVANGSFNPECLADGDYSHSTTILIVLNPNKQGTALFSTSIGLIIQWCMGPVGQINDIKKFIMHTHSMMTVDWQSSDNSCSKFCIIISNYGSHMGFATDPPFCMAYPLSFVNKDDPTQMTFRSQQNHPTFFTADTLLVCQLLTWDCPLHEYAMDRCHRCLLIPRGVHFLHDLFLQIIVPHDHVAPYCDPWSGEEAPFSTIGPFMSMDTLFPGTAVT